MSENNQIIHWIMIGIQQELDDPSELFYYDKKEKQFFSILHIDYLLFDQKLNIIDDISLYYTKEELNILRKRIKKNKEKGFLHSRITKVWNHGFRNKNKG